MSKVVGNGLVALIGGAAHLGGSVFIMKQQVDEASLKRAALCAGGIFASDSLTRMIGPYIFDQSDSKSESYATYLGPVITGGVYVAGTNLLPSVVADPRPVMYQFFHAIASHVVAEYAAAPLRNAIES